MIAWAYAFPSVWSMVAGSLLGSLLRALLSHVTIPGPRMGLRWQNEHIKEIVAFGKLSARIKSAPLKLGLNAKGRALLGKRGKVKATLTIVATNSQGEAQTVTKSVTVSRPKKKH